MLTLGTRFVEGAVELSFDLAVEREFRLFAIERRHTVWDSRHVPPLETPAEPHAMVYFVFDGSLTWRAPVEERYDAPAAFLATEEHIEGAAGRRSVTLRSWGNPFGALELRVRQDAIARGNSEGPNLPRRLELSERVWTRARVYAAATRTHKDHSARTTAATRLLAELYADGVIVKDLAATVVEDEGVRQRIWDAVTPFVRRAYFSPTLDELAGNAQVSLRQASRQLERVLSTFNIAPMRWRGVSGRFRLRVAIVVLSNPDVAIADVARLAGYSSAEALTHAFYAAGLPAPTVLRVRILEG